MTDVLDIVIVNYNSTEPLITCLQSIEAARGTLPSQVFIQDNASRDGVERILRRYKNVNLVRNPVNLGFGRAVNRGIRQGKAPYVMLLNPDTRILDRLLVDGVGYLERHPRIGILGPRILDPDGKVQGSARTFPTPLTALFGRNTILSRLFPRNRFTRANVLTSRSDGRTPIQVDWVSGACMFVRREALATVGLMDPRFFMYWEDADWCRRMWQAGWEVVYWPRGTVVHQVGASSRQVRLRAALEFHKSAYRLFDKYRRWPGGFNALVIGALAVRLALAAALAVLRGMLSPRHCGEGSSKGLTPEGSEDVAAWNQ